MTTKLLQHLPGAPAPGIGSQQCQRAQSSYLLVSSGAEGSCETEDVRMAAGYRRRQLRGRREAKQGVRRRQLRGRHEAKQGAKGREVIGAREAQQVKTVRWRGLAMSGSRTRQQTTAVTATVE